jgi:hypothetical protein
VVLCLLLLLATSMAHPAHELLQRTAHTCGGELSSAAWWAVVWCRAMRAEHVTQGTYTLVALYLLGYYLSKALPARLWHASFLKQA